MVSNINNKNNMNNLIIIDNLERIFNIDKLNDLYYHMFLDNYIYEGKGNDAILTCRIFKYLLMYYKNDINYTEIVHRVIDLIKYYTDAINIIKLFEEEYDVYKNCIDKILYKNKKIFIVSLWSESEYADGHLIGIFIELIETELKNNYYYKVTIFNSGSGISNHIGYRGEITDNIIISFTLENIEQFENLIILIKQCNCKKKFKIKSEIERNSMTKNYRTILFKDNDNDFNDQLILDSFKNNIKLKNLFSEYRKYIKNDYFISEHEKIKNYFYNRLYKIIPKEYRLFEKKYDKIQLSGSCTYFGNYYFIKYILKEDFELFIKFSKNVILDIICKNLNNCEKNNNSNNNNSKKIIFSSLLLLCKDKYIDYNNILSKLDLNKFSNIYSEKRNIFNLIQQTNENIIFEYLDNFKHIYFKLMEEIKENILNINGFLELCDTYIKINFKLENKVKNINVFSFNFILNILSKINIETIKIIKDENILDILSLKLFDIFNIKKYYKRIKIKISLDEENNENNERNISRYYEKFKKYYEFTNIILYYILKKNYIIKNSIKITSNKLLLVNNYKVLSSIFENINNILFKLNSLNINILDILEIMDVKNDLNLKNSKNSFDYLLYFNIINKNNNKNNKNIIIKKFIHECIDKEEINLPILNNTISYYKIISSFNNLEILADTDILYYNFLRAINTNENIEEIQIINKDYLNIHNIYNKINYNDFINFEIICKIDIKILIENIKSNIININELEYNKNIDEFLILLFLIIKFKNIEFIKELIDIIGKIADENTLIYNIIKSININGKNIDIDIINICNNIFYNKSISIINSTIYDKININKFIENIKGTIINNTVIYDKELYSIVLNNDKNNILYKYGLIELLNKNDDLEHYYYIFDENIFEFKYIFYENIFESNSLYYFNFNDIYYEIIDHNIIEINNLNIILKFLYDNNIKFFILKNENNYIIFLFNHLNLYILYDTDKNISILKDNINNSSYEIIINSDFFKSNYLLLYWMYGLENGLLLKKENNLNNDYTIILFLNNNNINLPKLFRSEFRYCTFNGIREPNNLNEHKYYEYCYINLHYSYLYPLNNDSKSLSMLIISLYIAYNIIYIPYFYIKYLNCIQNIINNNNDFLKNILKSYNTEYYFERFFLINMRDLSFNTPLWILNNSPFISNELKNYLNLNLSDSHIDYRYNKFLDYNKTILNNINNKINFNITLNEKNSLIYNLFIDFSDKIRTKLNNSNNEENQETEKNIINYLNKVIFKCLNITLNNSNTYNNSNFKKVIKNSNSIDIYDQNIILSYIFSKMNTDTNPNIYNIYKDNYNIYYNVILRRNLNFIRENLIEISLDIKKNINNINYFKYFIEKCYLLGEIIKNIHKDVVDLNIVDNIFNKNITNGEFIFEMESGFFIRLDQQKFLKDIQLNNIYQLLMGRGKSSTITPILLLNENKKEKNYFIILPKNLVNSAFDIINQYQKFLNKKIFILNDKSNIYNSTDLIGIITDTNIKINYLNVIINNDNLYIENYNKFLKKNLYIIDEVDSLINPLQSNLNIIKQHINEYKPHIHENIIFNILFDNLTNNVSKNLNESENINVQIIENIKIKLLEVKTFLKKWEFKKNYGFGDYISNNIKNFFIGIPYKYINDPVNGSKFSNYEISLGVTILSYLNNGLRYEDIELYFIHIYNEYIKYNFDISTFKEIFLIFKSFFNLFTKEDYENLIYSCELSQILFQNKLKILYNDKISNSLKKKEFFNKELIKSYLEVIILPNFLKINNYLYNITFLDILGLFNSKYMFTGTVDILIPKNVFNENIIYNNKMVNNKDINVNESNKLLDKIFLNIIEDSYSISSIKAAIYGSLFKKKPKLYTNSSNNINNKEDNLLDFLFNKDNLKEFQVLIDIGGFFLKKTTFYLVKEIHKYFYDNGINKKILYVNENNQKTIYNGKINISYNNEIIPNNEIFIYYDNKNTIGIDFKQPNELNGLAIIDVHKNTITDVAQGIFRMRKINVTHKINFYLNEIISNNKELYLILKKNSKNLKNNSIESMLNQTISYLYKKSINVNTNINNLFKKKVYYELEFNNEINNKEIKFLEAKKIILNKSFNHNSKNLFEFDIEQENELNFQKNVNVKKNSEQNQNTYLNNNSINLKCEKHILFKEKKIFNFFTVKFDKIININLFISNELIYLKQDKKNILNKKTHISFIKSQIILIKDKHNDKSYSLITRDELFLYKQNYNLNSNYFIYDIFSNYKLYNNNEMIIFILVIILDIEKNINTIYKKIKIIRSKKNNLSELDQFITIFKEIEKFIGVKNKIININVFDENNSSEDEFIIKLFYINRGISNSSLDLILKIIKGMKINLGNKSNNTEIIPLPSNEHEIL